MQAHVAEEAIGADTKLCRSKRLSEFQNAYLFLSACCQKLWLGNTICESECKTDPFFTAEKKNYR